MKPNEILAITFTNKAATEMRERLERTLGGMARAIWILTFHAACGRILRREAERLGYRSSFTIYDQADQVRLVKACLEELGKDPKRFTPRGIHHQISNAKNTLVSPDEYLSRVSSFWDQTVAEVYALYQKRLSGLERGRLRRHADAHRRDPRAVPGGSRSTGSTPSGTSSSTSTRTRTTRSTGSSSSWRQSTRT